MTSANPEQKRRQGLKADYRGATPEQVAQAVHRHRPNKPESDSESWLRMEVVRGADGTLYTGAITEHDEPPPPPESD